MRLATILILLLLISPVAEGIFDVDRPFEIIPASEILGKLKSGTPVKYDNVLIKGDLDLRNLGLLEGGSKWLTFEEAIEIITMDNLNHSEKQRIISVPIEIKNSIIDGNVDFHSVTFLESVDFMHTLITGSSYFYMCNFKKESVFLGAIFNGHVYFQGSKFDDKGIFAFVYFNESAEFRLSKFNDSVTFVGSKFNNSTNFKRSSFDGASFISTEFNGPAEFSDCTFNVLATFAESEFNSSADFNGSSFNTPVDFRQSTFLDSLDLTAITFNRAYFNWPSIKHLISDGPTYLALIKNFKELEQFEAADDIYFQYRRWRQDQKLWSDISKYIDILGLITCGYGVRVNQTINFAMIILVLFGAIYSIIGWKQACDYTSYTNLIIDSFIGRQRSSENIKYFKIIKEHFLLSLIILISAPGELYPLGGNEYRNKIDNIKYWPILERLIGWGLMLLLINTLSRVMIRY